MRHRYSLCYGLILLQTLVVDAYAAPVQYPGMCDASAAVMLDDDKFVVANDEDNILRIYSLRSPGKLISTLDLKSFLNAGKEADIEGAARIGNRIYWITSHGRNKNAEPKPNRRRFFATDIHADKSGIELVPVGRGERGLDTLFDNGIGQRYGLQQAAERAPETPNALNIEGLAANFSGDLLIGFRNPIPHGHALVVPLKNPDRFINDKTKDIAAEFGNAIELDLDGLGIRSFDAVPGTSAYLIVAGAAGKGPFAMYGWRPPQKPVKLETALPADFRPEGLMIDPDHKAMHLISDDGDDCPKPAAFRMLTLPLPSW
jgi:hypothetical protein